MNKIYWFLGLKIMVPLKQMSKGEDIKEMRKRVSFDLEKNKYVELPPVSLETYYWTKEDLKVIDNFAKERVEMLKQNIKDTEVKDSVVDDEIIHNSTCFQLHRSPAKYADSFSKDSSEETDKHCFKIDIPKSNMPPKKDAEDIHDQIINNAMQAIYEEDISSNISKTQVNNTNQTPISKQCPSSKTTLPHITAENNDKSSESLESTKKTNTSVPVKSDNDTNNSNMEILFVNNNDNMIIFCEKEDIQFKSKAEKTNIHPKDKNDTLSKDLQSNYSGKMDNFKRTSSVLSDGSANETNNSIINKLTSIFGPSIHEKKTRIVPEKKEYAVFNNSSKLGEKILNTTYKLKDNPFIKNDQKNKKNI